MSYIRTIENELLIKDRHVIFSSFVTNCNGFVVVLSYRLEENISKEIIGRKDGEMYRPKMEQNKLYIFVVELATGRVVSSSYREVKHVIKTRNRFEYEKTLRQSFTLSPNRYSTNRQLEFILQSPSELSFYRVTSMFTLQTL